MGRAYTQTIRARNFTLRGPGSFGIIAQPPTVAGTRILIRRLRISVYPISVPEVNLQFIFGREIYAGDRFVSFPTPAKKDPDSAASTWRVGYWDADNFPIAPDEYWLSGAFNSRRGFETAWSRRSAPRTGQPGNFGYAGLAGWLTGTLLQSVSVEWRTALEWEEE